MKKLLHFLPLLLVLAILSACGVKEREVKRLILESQAQREAGDLARAEELLIQATKIRPLAEEPWLELGILKDEYLKDQEDARTCYENFLTVSRNPKMQEMVRGWLADQKAGLSLPLTEVSEMPREARELLERRTAQFEELRRNLVSRYESELDKYREDRTREDVVPLVLTQTVEVVSNAGSLEEKDAEEAKIQLAEAREKARQAEAELAALKVEKEKLKELLASESRDKEEARQREQELKDLKKREKTAENEARALAERQAKAENEALLAQAEAEKRARLLAEEKARKLEEEKRIQAERLDAFVKDVVQAGSEAADKSVVTAREMEKISQQTRPLDLELSEDQDLSEAASRLEVPEIPGLAANLGTNETKLAGLETEAPAATGGTDRKKAGDTAAAKPGNSGETSPKAADSRKEGGEDHAIHIVAQGDSLGSISRKYYGEFRRWREIYEANRDVLPNPDRLKLGMKLRIPNPKK